MENNFDEKALQRAKNLASSPAGQELMQLMKNMDKDTLSKMMQQAASGNFTGLSDSLSPFLGSEKVQTLLRQMEEK